MIILLLLVGCINGWPLTNVFYSFSFYDISDSASTGTEDTIPTVALDTIAPFSGFKVSPRSIPRRHLPGFLSFFLPFFLPSSLSSSPTTNERLSKQTKIKQDGLSCKEESHCGGSRASWSSCRNVLFACRVGSGGL